MGGDVEKGRKIFKQKCAQCHTYNKGGGNKTGKLICSSILQTSYYLPIAFYRVAEKSQDTIHDPTWAYKL